MIKGEEGRERERASIALSHKKVKCLARVPRRKLKGHVHYYSGSGGFRWFVYWVHA